MKPELKLTPDALLISDLQMPQFYSLKFEFRIDQWPETSDDRLILGLTDGLGNMNKVGYREPAFGIENQKLIVKISSKKAGENPTEQISDKYQKWLSFIQIFIATNCRHGVPPSGILTQIEIHKD